MPDLVRRDVKLSGFVANDIKSQRTPAQRGELLGFVLDLSAGTFQVPQRRVDSFCLLLENIVSKGFVASACQLSRFTGLLTSMGLTLGPVVRLWMQILYHDILNSASWDSPFHMSDIAECEVLFWRDNFDNSGYPIWSPSPKPEVLLFSMLLNLAGAVSLPKLVGRWLLAAGHWNRWEAPGNQACS